NAGEADTLRLGGRLSVGVDVTEHGIGLRRRGGDGGVDRPVHLGGDRGIERVELALARRTALHEQTPGAEHRVTLPAFRLLRLRAVGALVHPRMAVEAIAGDGQETRPAGAGLVD